MKVKNVSNLTKTLAVVSLLAPASAQPLGIGDIELHSALNQNLNAVIKLSLAAGENPSDISVRLAPVEKFDQAGVPWNYFLSKIKLEPVVQANGNVIVKITSREALTEPFLDFLLEVSWPQGSQIREYTLLIDPPADYHAPVVPSAESGGVRVEALEDYDRPVRKSRSSSKRRQSRSDAGITPQTPTSGEYGPVRNQDTLWSIAEQLGAERNVPTRQMLNALYQANPDAFNNGNMDLLKAGVTLKIPETGAIVQGAAAQPSTKRGEEKTVKEAVAAPKSVVANNKGLELVAPTDAKITDSAKVGGQAKSGADATTGAIGASGGDSVSGKDRELQSRIEKLEQQLGMMQQLLALKDQQLANLQNKDKAVADQGAPAVPKVVVPLPKEPTQTEPQQPVVQPPITPPQQPVVQQPPAAVTPQPAPPQAKPKPKPPKPVAPPVSEDSGWMSSSGYYLTVGGLGVGILGALGWLWWRKRRIEDQTNTESMFASASQIKMPDADSSLSVPVMEMTGAGSYDVGTVGESSFISDFTPSDFDAFDTDQNEVDPMSEADVYLAYGRYQQAEDLIRHAIEEQPARDEYKLKLLEILYANENRDAFAVYAQQLADAGKQADRPFWAKVSDMAKELIPECALFGGTEAVPAAHAKADFERSVGTGNDDAEVGFSMEPDNGDGDTFPLDTLNDDLVDLDAPTLPDMALMNDVSSELAELQLTSAEPESTTDNGLDFDLSSFSTDSAAKPAYQAEQPFADIETIDFDLSSFSVDAKAEDKSAQESEAAEDKLESFDFNFDFDEPKPAADDQAEVEQPLDMASLESYEFPDLDTLAEEKEATVQPEPVAETATESSADEFDFNFDFDAPVSLSDDASGMGSSVADLTDMDEFETKIDLAKAYIDMGDAEAARAIAQEVLEKGSKEQKVAAQAILNELE